LVRMDHEDINMLELPLAPSKKYPGVVADIKFYQEEKEPIVPIEQLVVADKGTFVAMSVFLSGHLFTESNFANLQTPAGKDQFLSALCRLP
ncbi:MAG: hypothetical protein M1142_03315, partial [Patescibacteria group bacterium]|nr:hypothetical protein [Patescibacteria group bacterium]